MALNNSNNLLMQRIKRILGMTDVQNRISTYKIMLIVLIAGGLFGFTWFSDKEHPNAEMDMISSVRDVNGEIASLPIVTNGMRQILTDTLIEEDKKDEDVKFYSRTYRMWTDEDGNVHEESVEHNDDDFDMSFHTPDLDIRMMIPDFDDMPDVSALLDEALQGMDENFRHSYNFQWNDTLPDTRRDEFENMHNFEIRMKEMFEQQRRVMEEMKIQMQRMHSINLEKSHGEKKTPPTEEMQMQRDEMHQRMKEKEMKHHNALVEKEKMMMEKERMLRKKEFSLLEEQEKLSNAEKQIAKEEEKIKAIEKNMKAYEKELIKELKKDGYLNNNEDLKNFSIRYGNRMQANGKQIKPEDFQKYEELRKKYLEE